MSKPDHKRAGRAQRKSQEATPTLIEDNSGEQLSGETTRWTVEIYDEFDDVYEDYRHACKKKKIKPQTKTGLVRTLVADFMKSEHIISPEFCELLKNKKK